MGVELLTIEAAQQGDREALAAIVDDFMPTVLGARTDSAATGTLAGDIAQEVFATLVVRLGDLRDPAALPGWLMAVVRSSASTAASGTPAGPVRAVGGRPGRGRDLA